MHVLAGVGRSQGGPCYSVPRLAEGLRQVGVGSEICSVAAENDPPLFPDNMFLAEQDFRSLPVLRSLRMSSGLKRILREKVPGVDIVHAHGLWLMPNVYAGMAARRAGKPLIVSPRGMLAPDALAFSKMRKTAFWQTVQGPAYAGAAAWHATCEAEVEEIRSFGIRAPVALIPNGVDLPDQSLLKTAVPFRVPGRKKTLLFLSRFHPKKGASTLLKAWMQVAVEFPDWRLRLVGPDEAGHRAQLEADVLKAGIPRVEFSGPLYGNDKWKTYAQSDLFVLPTLNENFGISVAEALGCGVPAIVTVGAPWKGLNDHRCGWWIGKGEAPLVDALRSGMSLEDGARAEMGGRGRQWVAQEFSWTRIADQMKHVYNYMLGEVSAPPFIRLTTISARPSRAGSNPP